MVNIYTSNRRKVAFRGSEISETIALQNVLILKIMVLQTILYINGTILIHPKPLYCGTFFFRFFKMLK